MTQCQPNFAEAELEYCEQCGYCLIGLRTQKCSECGLELDARVVRRYSAGRKQRKKTLRWIFKVNLLAIGTCILVAILGRTIFWYLQLWPEGETMYWLTDGKSPFYNVSVAAFPMWLFTFFAFFACLKARKLMISPEFSPVHRINMPVLLFVELIIFLALKIFVENIAFFD